MAQFRATIRGQRGEASRLGSKKTGLRANINAWNIGVQVIANTDKMDRDKMDIYITAGSKQRFQPIKIGEIFIDANGKPKYMSEPVRSNEVC